MRFTGWSCSRRGGGGHKTPGEFVDTGWTLMARRQIQIPSPGCRRNLSF
jgi:hypothetical protein